MNLRRMLTLMLIGSVVLASCANLQPPASGTPAASTGAPRFEMADCWFEMPDGQTAECGYLIVPEDRSRPDGKTIQVAVARFKSASDSPKPDPIVYLEGGPGGSPLKSAIEQFNQVFGPLTEERDLILIDQRGTGYSEPSLFCPEYRDWSLSVLDQDLSIEESEKQSNAAMLACRNRLAGEGVNLAAYNSAENAADLSDLREALGIEQWNLFGISYGTRLALTALRDHSQGLRSVVIDSVVPPQVDLYASTPGNGARALEALFEACAAAAECSARYPNLRETFFEMVDRLNDRPAVFPITLKSGEQRDMLMNGDGLVGSTFQFLYITSFLPFMPRLIDDVHAGNYALIGYLQGQLMEELNNISFGMHFSVQCGEEVPFDTRQQVQAAIDQYPDYRALGGTGVFDLCAQWGAGTPQSIEDQAVSSDVPTLVLSGQFDPITPPAWGELAAQTLSRSVYIELPNSGHGASLTGGDCPRGLALAFIDDPTSKPDDSCIAGDMAEMTFTAPANSMSVRMVPLDEPLMQIEGVVPDGWQAVGSGAYTPSGSVEDTTALLYQAAPIDAQRLLALFATSFEQAGVKTEFKEAGTRQANGLEWTLYTADLSIIAVDAALAESGGTTYLVMMQSLIDERESLVEAVFLPAVDALKPAQ